MFGKGNTSAEHFLPFLYVCFDARLPSVTPYLFLSFPSNHPGEHPKWGIRRRSTCLTGCDAIASATAYPPRSFSAFPANNRVRGAEIPDSDSQTTFRMRAALNFFIRSETNCPS